MMWYIIIGLIVMIAAIMFLIRWLFYRKEQQEREILLQELAPWVESLQHMTQEQLDTEVRRISRLLVASKENAAKLDLQMEIVCAEDDRRRKSKSRFSGLRERESEAWQWIKELFFRKRYSDLD